MRRQKSSLTAQFGKKPKQHVFLLLSKAGLPLYNVPIRRGARVVELACLENKCASNGTEGSNPSLSARI
jgi:hypothetical protein